MKKLQPCHAGMRWNTEYMSFSGKMAFVFVGLSCHSHLPNSRLPAQNPGAAQHFSNRAIMSANQRQWRARAALGSFSFLRSQHNTVRLGGSRVVTYPLSLPLLSLITPRFHFNDFLVALGGPVNHPSVGRVEFASKQSHFISLVFSYNCFKHRCY